MAAAMAMGMGVGMGTGTGMGMVGARTRASAGGTLSVRARWRSFRPRCVPRTRAGTSASVATEGGATKAEGLATARPAAEVWTKAWYPVAFTKFTDREVPNRVVVLGRPLVVWFDRKADLWRAFWDRCPHRLVPLSEGRIDERGELQCGYHGWSFDGEGACTAVPQATEAVAPGARESRRACATTVPCVERQGMIWVWPAEEASDGASVNAEAGATALPLLPELDDPQWVCIDISRDLPYSALTLLENVLDVSHIPFTHHESVGNRRYAGSLELELDAAGVTASGFRGRWEEGPRQGRYGPQTTTFAAPNLMYHRIDAAQYSTMTVVYATPTTPGRCRLLARFPFNFRANKLPAALITGVPSWWNHMSQNFILEDDQIFLHLQEREVEAKRAEGGRDAWASLYYMPTSADAYVRALREWVDVHAGPPAMAPGAASADPAAAVAAAAPPTKRALVERLHSHVDHCRVCRDAYRRLAALKAASGLAALACLALGTVAPAGLRPLVAALAATATLLFAFAAKTLVRMAEGSTLPNRNRPVKVALLKQP